MKQLIERLRQHSETLPFRIAALLALALLPIGLISVTQTVLLIRESDDRTKASLLALTSEAAAGEEAHIRTAFGAALAIRAMLSDGMPSQAECEFRMQRFLKESGSFSFAGYVDGDGIIRCASGGHMRDMSQLTIFPLMKADPVPRVTINRNGPVSGTSVLVMSVPVMDGEKFDGYIAISLPHRTFFGDISDASERSLVNLITFNAQGAVLTNDHGLDEVVNELPVNHDLTEFVAGNEYAFIDVNADGKWRVYSVVPVVPKVVYAMGIWEYESYASLTENIKITNSVLFPVAMWLACLGVAFFAVQRMVIRPTRDLRARMLLFMRARRIFPPRDESKLPIEIREIEETWQLLAESVLQDEAELHNSIHKKAILVKEVHHRVKNNLQLIASILSMKIRKSRSIEVRHSLQEVQRRVMSIARVHQKLYETSTEERVRADELLRTIISQIKSSALPNEADVRYSDEFESIVLYPDQAVPLSLAASEMLTNALKYMGKPSDGQAWLSVRLVPEGKDRVLFEVANSIGEKVDLDVAITETGLGDKLIAAFVQQMEGEVETVTEDSVYRIRIHFPIIEFTEAA
ncbi:sensor histidine kinase [Thalassobius vesicularis]|uniref:histidine kinase n=1 Tax=Thalassobius vesicularis TaxID=1294297 RepID=A0A4S3M9G6_9RHOB|nr:histidine kinase dimerization/phosphoacceptor domain -containing protein [Thalassobius vesicularis]THD72794.1 sensor histidine kinase [Thalassobius vesicularis]